MEAKQTVKKKVPRHGFINELAKLCKCSRHTVRLALYEGQRGEKSDLVRRVYQNRYVQFNKEV